jgi:hypothetical protein
VIWDFESFFVVPVMEAVDSVGEADAEEKIGLEREKEEPAVSVISMVGADVGELVLVPRGLGEGRDDFNEWLADTSAVFGSLVPLSFSKIIRRTKSSRSRRKVRQILVL